LLYLNSLVALKLRGSLCTVTFEYRYSAAWTLVPFGTNWARNGTFLRRNETCAANLRYLKAVRPELVWHRRRSSGLRAERA
jgi:hypothetical protein